jgi:gliding motility-associated-like protein
LTSQLKIFASRAVGGELIYSYNSVNNYYDVTLIIYFNCASRTTLLTNYSINYKSVSCNKQGIFSVRKKSEIEITPKCKGQKTTCQGGTAFGYKKIEYKGVFIPPNSCEDWVLSWVECNRNQEITTIQNPNSQCLYIEAKLNNKGRTPTSVYFNSNPVLELCVGQKRVINFLATDDFPENIFTFENIIPRTSSNSTITYKPGFSKERPISLQNNLSVDESGNMILEPTIAGEHGVFALKVDNFYNGNTKVFLGSVTRETQFITKTCSNLPPTLTFNGISDFRPFSQSICVEQDHCFSFFASDPNPGDNVYVNLEPKLNALKRYDAFFDNNVAFIPGGNPTGAGFCWRPQIFDQGVKQISVTVTDSACPQAASQTYLYNLTINSPLRVELPFEQMKVNCVDDVIIKPTVTGGIAPYQYYWSSGETTPFISKKSGEFDLKVVDAVGCFINKKVFLDAGIRLDLDYADACFGGESRFVDKTVTTNDSYQIISRQWDFGDGTGVFSTLTTTIGHTYSNFGKFDVTYTVKNSIGCEMTHKFKTFVCKPPDFNIVASNLCESNYKNDTCDNKTSFSLAFREINPLNCQRTSSIYWNFGNSIKDTTREIMEITSAYYNTPSNYNVKAEISLAGCNLITVDSVFTILESPNFDLNTYNFINKCDSRATILSFTTTSGNFPPIKNYWYRDYIITDSLKSTLTASIPGLYTLSLKNNLNCSTQKCVTSIKSIHANFLPSDFCAKTNLIPMNNGSSTLSPPYSTFWDFGDGTSSTAQNPSHLYAFDSVFVATLYITDNTNCKDTAVKLVQTYLPYDTLEVINDTTCFSEKIMVKGPKGKSIEEYHWNLGNGELKDSSSGFSVSRFLVQSGNPPTQIEKEFILDGGDGYYLPRKSGKLNWSLKLRYNNSCLKYYYDDSYVFKTFKVDARIDGKRCIGNIITFTGIELKKGDYEINTWNTFLYRNPAYPVPTFVDTTKTGLPISVTGNLLIHNFVEQDDYLLRIKASDKNPFHTCYVDSIFDASVNRIVAPDFTITGSCVNSQKPLVNIEIKDIYQTQDSTFFDFGEIGDTIVPVSGKLTNGLIKSYKAPGFYNIKVKSINFKFNCQDSIIKVKKIYALPEPIISSNLLVCELQNTTFKNIALLKSFDQPIKSSTWDFGNAIITSTSAPVSYQFSKWGSYPISLSVTDSMGCEGAIKDTIEVYPTPQAFFDFDQENALAYEPILFTDKSTGGGKDGYITKWKWNFSNQDTSSLQNPVYTFTKILKDSTNLLVTNQYGCVSDTSLLVDLNAHLIIPTVFSPNNDGTHDELFLIKKGVRELLDFKIFNRWGEIVFQTDRIDTKWDGKYKGELQPAGVYQYFVIAKNIYGERMTLQGNLTILH